MKIKLGVAVIVIGLLGCSSQKIKTAGQAKINRALASREGIICYDRKILDGHFVVQFILKKDVVHVELGIPVDEYSLEKAQGTCVTEEDTTFLSLRCDEVKNAAGDRYFVRIDDKKALVSQNAKILAEIPCEGSLD